MDLATSQARWRRMSALVFIAALWLAGPAGNP